jgi:FlaA1/EpsC-like NDP-sugar epimerase
MALDVVLIAASYFMALLLRFDFAWTQIPADYIAGYQMLMPGTLLMVIGLLWIFRLYHSVWSFASFSELTRLMLAWAVVEIALPLSALIAGIRMPISYWLIGSFLGFAATTTVRFSYRIARRLKHLMRHRAAKRVLIYGAGESGRALIREIAISPALELEVVAALDDNPAKQGKYIEGVHIVGGREDLAHVCDAYDIDQIIFAVPSCSNATRRELLEACSATGREVRAIPGMFQLVDGQVTVSALREVRLEDLLGREPIVVDAKEVRSFIEGRVCLVTGGGGSIGSELCRQIAKDNPKQLIIFDIYENNAYAIQQELRHNYPDLNLVTLIGSVRNTKRIRTVFETYRPELVFHAAAHKHVPLMEDSPCEAIKNNVIGTYKCAQAALDFGTRRFVLISTDKAVNPTNIMGASKRLCEMVVQMMDRRADALGKQTDYVAVRFGNVLGSNGSVVPLFKKQIAEGGPVTVTHPDITRFFMTIPEAVSLVLQSAFYAYGGEIFVLDMGEPVKIDDMARKLIRLAGYEPDVDIKIVYTGLRPGEKLYEERLMDEEGLKKTANDLISIAEPIPMDDAAFEGQLLRLDELSIGESPRIREVVAEIVPTYHPEQGGQAA